jgi:hypothetical protein
MDNDEASTNNAEGDRAGDGESWLAEQVRLITLEDGLA